MATKYLDVDISAGKRAAGVVQNTSTVTNHVRVAWDTTVSRDGLANALRAIAEDVVNSEKFPDGVYTTDSAAAIDRTIAD